MLNMICKRLVNTNHPFLFFIIIIIILSLLHVRAHSSAFAFSFLLVYMLFQRDESPRSGEKAREEGVRESTATVGADRGGGWCLLTSSGVGFPTPEYRRSGVVFA